MPRRSAARPCSPPDTLLSSRVSLYDLYSRCPLLTSLLLADHPAEFSLDPIYAAFQGSADEVAARFDNAPAHLVDLYMNDFETESQELEEALGSGGLALYCGEVERLLREMPVEGEAAEGDDSMMGE